MIVDNKEDESNKSINNPAELNKMLPKINDDIALNSNKKEKLTNNNISDMLENELKSLRKNQDKLFFNFETNCKVKNNFIFNSSIKFSY